MDKEVRKIKIEYPLEWTYGVEIKKIREDLEALEKLGATHVEIDGGISYDVAYVEIGAYTERLETDEEFSTRVARLNKVKNELMRRELEQLARLKLKYETVAE